jgi:catechol 2,3-dioxygenase-like lactoylglutathione lyase family enzyme
VLNHVALAVDDRERSAAFYARHFGLTERVHEDEHLLIVGAPDGSLLALSEGEVPAELPRTNHFGFELRDPEQVRSARESLRAAGVPELEFDDQDGFVRVQVSDPDGYRVELFASPRPSRRPRSRWTSFATASEPKERTLGEEGNPAHRARVEHNRDTLLVHLSGEDGDGWTVMAVDRATRRWAVAQAARQADAAAAAFDELYGAG